MENYIEKLKTENKQQDLVDFMQEYFKTANVYFYENDEKHASLIFKDREYDFIGIYQISNFDCVKKEPDFKVDNFSKWEIKDIRVKKAYLKFMKTNFPEYKEDFLKSVMEQALDILGE